MSKSYFWLSVMSLHTAHTKEAVLFLVLQCLLFQQCAKLSIMIANASHLLLHSMHAQHHGCNKPVAPPSPHQLLWGLYVLCLRRRACVRACVRAYVCMYVCMYVSMPARDVLHALLLPVFNKAEAMQHQRSGSISIPVLASQSPAAALQQTSPVHHR